MTKTQAWDPFAIDNRLRLQHNAVENMRKRLRDFDADPDAVKRRGLPECRYCYYIARPGIGGRAVTLANCGICGTPMRFSSTLTDLLCEECADTKHLCRHCGCPMDGHYLRSRPHSGTSGKDKP